MKEKEKILIENLIDKYIKEELKCPTFPRFVKANPVLSGLFPENDFNIVLRNFLIKRIKKMKTNIGKVLNEILIKDEAKFKRFIDLNLNGADKEFQQLGKTFLEQIENAKKRLIKNTESGKFDVFVDNLIKKFDSQLLIIFPKYYSIGVVIKKIKK